MTKEARGRQPWEKIRASIDMGGPFGMRCSMVCRCPACRVRGAGAVRIGKAPWGRI